MHRYLIAPLLAVLALLACLSPPLSADATHDGTRCRHDFDGNHYIDIFDISGVAGYAFQASPPVDPMYDVAPILEPNGQIDIFDISLVAGEFGLECYGHSETSALQMSVGGSEGGPGILSLFFCEFQVDHRIHGKTANGAQWGFALVSFTVYTVCLTDQGANYTTDCWGWVNIQYDTPNGPWYLVGTTQGSAGQTWGTRCYEGSGGVFPVQRGQMLRDQLWHSLIYIPTGQATHGPHDHAQWYQWIIP